MRPVRVDDLDVLEARFQHAFGSATYDGLDVIGYGEITSVVAWPGPDGPIAAKRLPAFRAGEGVDAYLTLLADYLEGLRGAGIDVVPTRAERLVLDGGDVAVYLLQPMIDESLLGHRYLRNAPTSDAAALLEKVFDAVESAIGSGVGLDAQISNWALVGDSVVYFDVTTPLLRDESGCDRLDTGIFLASLPWPLRGVVRRFMVQGIIDEYFDIRTTILNLLAQFYKERLTELIPLALERANTRLERPFTADEVRSYYAKDARLWEFLQRLRRVDRWWHLHVLHRAYSFLLPGRVER